MGSGDGCDEGRVEGDNSCDGGGDPVMTTVVATGFADGSLIGLVGANEGAGNG